jgi:hypothetical protein
MHLRYDPINHTVMSGRTSLHDVAIRDLDFIRRRMRDICSAWDHQRYYTLRLPDEMRMARHFDAMERVPLRVSMRTVDIELVRPPQMDRFPMPDGRRAAEEKAMRMMMAYNAGDANLAMVLEKVAGIDPKMFLRDIALPPKPAPMMPPLDAPKPAPRAQAQKCHWEDGEAFIAALRKRGYATLGAGCFSTVLVKGNSKRVIKVNRSRPDGWLDYVIWAAKAGHMGKHAPMVHSFRRFNEGKQGEFYVAVMERMSKTVSAVSFKQPEVSRLHQHLRAGMHRSDRDALAAEKVSPGALKFAIEYRLEFPGHSDLHDENFMIREDGSMACIDPISGKATGSHPSRWRNTSARLAA